MVEITNAAPVVMSGLGLSSGRYGTQGLALHFGPMREQCPPKPPWSDSSPLPSGYVKIAIENCHRNSGFTH